MGALEESRVLPKLTDPGRLDRSSKTAATVRVADDQILIFRSAESGAIAPCAL